MTHRFTSLLAASLMSAGMIGAATAAAPRDAAGIQAQYEQQRATCLSGRSNQDQATCLKEAGAAREEARRGLLDTSSRDSLRANALARCGIFKGEEAVECRARVLEPTAVSGSVGAGGELREKVTIVPAPVPAPALAPPVPALPPSTPALPPPAPALAPPPAPASPPAPAR